MLRSRAWLVPAVLGAAAFFADSGHAGARLDVEARNASGAAPISGFSHTYGATVADWNSDGWDDVHYESFPRLMVNTGGARQQEGPCPGGRALPLAPAQKTGEMRRSRRVLSDGAESG